MYRFLKDTDYDDQIRQEIRNILDNTTDLRKLRQAEEKAIAQVKMRLSSRYDITRIFNNTPDNTPDTRNQFIVMLLVDIVLYHLWSTQGQIPKIRNDRYQDALDWLKSVFDGAIVSDLPTRPDNEIAGGAQIYSLHAADNNKY